MCVRAPPLPTVAPTRVPTVHSLPPSLAGNNCLLSAPAERWCVCAPGQSADGERRAAGGERSSGARVPISTG